MHHAVHDDEHTAQMPSSYGIPDESDEMDVSAYAPVGLAANDQLTSRCLDDLIDDWQRKGGRLSYDDVTRMSTKRKLNGQQLASLLEGLSQAGVTVSGFNSSPGSPPAEDPGDESAGEATRADRDSLSMYLAEVGRYPLLYAVDEVRLGRLIKAGQDADAALAAGQDAPIESALEAKLMMASAAGRRAHDDLVLANLRLVVSVARQSRYAAGGVDLVDRIQDGNLGLMRAAEKFDYTLGYKFSTYAMWWICQAIERGIADKGKVIRLPVHFHEKLLKVVRTRRRLTDEYGREPTLEELASATDMDPGTVKGALDWAKPVESLDRVLVHDGDLTYGDLLSDAVDIDGRGDPVDVVLNAARLRDITEALGGILDPRSAMIIARRYGIGSGAGEETLQAIADDLHLTRERVRQLEVKAMEALMAAAVQGGLYEYLVADTRLGVATPPGWSPPATARKGKKAPPKPGGRRQRRTSSEPQMRS